MAATTTQTSDLANPATESAPVSEMTVAMLSTQDTEPGAARGAYRLHRALLDRGVQSRMLVQTKQSDDPTVLGMRPKSGLAPVATGLRDVFHRLPLQIYRQRQRTIYSSQWLPDRQVARVNYLNPDIVSLQWVCGSYLQIESLAKLRYPVVWTLRDMWPFTGGCHYDRGCNRFQQSCGRCPHLGSDRDFDLSRWVWKRKRRAWNDLDLTLVCISSWLADCARASALFGDRRIEVIHNCIDVNCFKPVDKLAARHLLNLPPDKTLILFGAVRATSDRRKGFHLLQPALHELSQQGRHRDVELVVFGASQPESPPDYGFTTHYLGRFRDDVALAAIYAAADVFVAPSIQEAFGNTLLEALACGIPTVAFGAGGPLDIIEHSVNGYLAKPFESADLARGIAWILDDSERYRCLSKAARTTALEKFTPQVQAKRYAALFQDLLHHHQQN